jgi:hypothetical protein
LQQFITRDCAVFIQVNRFNDILGEIEGYAGRFGLPIGRGQLGALLSMQLTGRIGFPGLDLARPIGLFLLKNGDSTDIVFMLPITDQGAFRALQNSPVFAGNAVRFRDRYAIMAEERVLNVFERGTRKATGTLPNAQILFYVDTTLLREEAQGIVSGAGGNRANQLADRLTALQEGIFGEMRGISYGLSFTAQGIEFVSSMETRPNGMFSSMMRAFPAGEPALIARMPADSYFVSGSKVDIKALQPMYELFSGVLDSLVSGLGSVSVDLLREAGNIYGDDIAVALVPGGREGFAAVGASRLLPNRDSRALMRSFAERFNALPAVRAANAASGGKLAIVYTPNAGRLGTDSYDLMRLEYTPASGGAQGEPRAATARMLQEFFTLYIANKDGIEYWAMGGGAESRLTDLLAGTRTRFTTTPAWRSITGSYGQQTKSGVYYLSSAGLIQETIRVLPRYGLDSGNTKAILDSLRRVQAGGGIYGISQFTNDVLMSRGTISRNEIDVIYNLIMGISNAGRRGR